MRYDLAIIGSGPGGYVAALRAARFGAKVALIDKNELGGTCLNWGCIPTKALAATAHTMAMVKRAQDFGVIFSPPLRGGDEGEGDRSPPTNLPPPATTSSAGEQGGGNYRFNFAKAQERKNTIVEDLRKGIGQLLKGSKVEVIKGEAAFTNEAQIAVDSQEIDAEKIIIATGSTWWTPPNIELGGKYIVTSTEALNWKKIPESLLIIGGGIIGCEFASIFSAFGSKITIVELMPSILPSVEKEISRLLNKSFKQRGIEIFTDTKVETATPEGGIVTVQLSNGEEKKVDCILVAVGRRPYTANLGLTKSGIKLTERSTIPINEKFETNVKNVFAIGDVVGGSMLAHVASAQAISCVEQMYGKGSVIDYHSVPTALFTVPEAASVGHTSQELEGLKIPFKTGRFSYAASGKAHCDGEKEGMAIVHVDDNGMILGAHFIGKDASLLVAEATLAIKHRLTAKQVGDTIHAHPTLSEVFAEAALDAVGEAMHKPVRKP